MQVLYRPILNIQIWHDYCLGQPAMPYELAADYDISSILSLVPTADCQRRLRNLRWLARPQAQGITLLADAIAPTAPNTAYRTKIAVNQPTRLTFWLKVKDPTFANFTNLPFNAERSQLKVKDPTFANFTNLPFNAERSQVYYFSNQLGTVQSYENADDYLFLSQSLAAYSAGDEYRLGQLVTAGDQTLESNAYQASAAAPAAVEWETLPLSQYVTALDRMPYQGLTRRQAIASANPGDTFSFALTDSLGQRCFTQTLTVPESHPPGEPIKAHLNFRGQSPGRYQLVLDGTPIDDEFIFFDRQAAPDAFALVEIVVDPTAADGFAVLQAVDGETLIQPRTYILRFKNRATRWRYRTQKAHDLTAEVLEPQGLTLLDSQTYVTSRPRGLLQKPNPPPLNNSQRNLPFPNTAQIKPLADENRRITQVFSDIYL